MLEIERKFLVSGDYKPYVRESLRISQGYICTLPGRTVRVRTKGDKAFLTIKGRPAEGHLGRFEWEKEIPVDEALELMKLCLPGILDKTRHLVDYEGHVFEVDEFHGVNEGLVIAEVELLSENEKFERPDWLGKEVTGDRRYYNSYLSQCPYSEWDK